MTPEIGLSVAACVLSLACLGAVSVLAYRSLPAQIRRGLSVAAERMAEYDADHATWSKRIAGLFDEIEAEGERTEKRRRQAAASASRASHLQPPNGAPPALDPLQIEVAAFHAIGRR